MNPRISGDEPPPKAAPLSNQGKFMASATRDRSSIRPSSRPEVVENFSCYPDEATMTLWAPVEHAPASGHWDHAAAASAAMAATPSPHWHPSMFPFSRTMSVPPHPILSPPPMMMMMMMPTAEFAPSPHLMHPMMMPMIAPPQHLMAMASVSPPPGFYPLPSGQTAFGPHQLLYPGMTPPPSHLQLSFMRAFGAFMQ